MEEIDFKDFFSHLKNYIFAFVIVLFLAVGGTIVYDTSFKKPIYQAQTTVVVSSTDTSANKAVTLNDINVSQKLAAEYSVLAKSDLVLNKVIDNLDLSTSAGALNKNLTVKAADGTAILNITVKNENARDAALIANEVVKVFSEEAEKIYGSDNVTQLSAAGVPSAPANNTMTRDAMLAALVSMVVVMGFAFLRFCFNDTLKDNDDIERTIGLPVAGRIAKGDIKKTKRAGNNELIAEKTPKAIASENIKSLRTNLQFTAVDRTLKTILVTSTNASEGKSFVAANLAISFAQTDKKVLLVDCDLRKGRVHKIFNIPNTKGLSNLLAGELRMFNKYVHSTKTKNLDVITCGTYPPNPSELLASKKNKQLINVLRDFYDVIIFDGAPVGGLADSLILSSFVDGVLLVVKDGNTSKGDLISVKSSLNKVGAKILGVVINMTDRKTSRYYNSYYYGESSK